MVQNLNCAFLMNSFKPSNSEYRIESCVGEGLTSIVYRAIRVDGAGRSVQRVALKVPKDEIWIPHLRQEFEVLSNLNSPYLTRVLAWESSHEQSALVIEWVDGLTLFEIAHSLDPSLIDEVIAQIQLGLNALRERGFHHGDLHPRNIMIDCFGYVKLLDATGGGGCRVGSPAYLSPERWKGEVSSYDSDLFALGLIQHDLRNRFTDLPESKSEAESRCFKLASEQHALLNPKSELRYAGEAKSNPHLRAELAEIVKSFKEARKKAMTATCVAESHDEPIAIPPMSRAKKYADNYAHDGVHKEAHKDAGKIARKLPRPTLKSVASALLFVISVPVGAGGPSQKFETQTGALNINSHRWVFIEINGRDVGYTPIRINRIHAGAHRIRWKSANAHGIAHISVQPGERLVLNESQLRRASKYGNTLN